MLTYHKGSKESLFFGRKFCIFIIQFQKCMRLKSTVTETFYNQICIAIGWFCIGYISFTQSSLEFYDRKMKMVLALRRMTNTERSRSRAWAHAWDAGVQSSNSSLSKACWVPLGESLNLPLPLFPPC